MTIQTFIEKAIEGGWKKDTFGQLKFGNYWGNQISLTYTREDGERGEWLYSYWAILLDPEAWKAVGKVSGWYEGQYKQVMEDMIAPLCAGRTIEEYIATL